MITLGAEEARLQGTTRVEDLVNSLPQAFGGQGGNLSNFSTGTASVDLRGLGATRTLVLVNGRRLLPGDPRTPEADINIIPASLIKRVDVLTGGASSVYGSDAVAGVANFILDTEVEGFRVNAQYGFFTHENDARADVIAALNRRGFRYPRGRVTDGGSFDGSIAYGAPVGERGHVSAYVGYRSLDPVVQGNRDFSACSVSGSPLACGGSSFSESGRFFLANGSSVTVAGNQFVPFDVNRDTYNFAPFNYFQREDERYTAGAFADYEISEAFHPYAELLFMRDDTVAQIAPSGNPGSTLTVPCDNPLLSAQQRGIACAVGNLVDTNRDGVADVLRRANGSITNLGTLQINRRNVEAGPRRDEIRHTDYRAVGGVRGQIDAALSYDAYYQFGRVDFRDIYGGDSSITRLRRSVDVTSVNGVATCASVLDRSDLACVPYNPFAAGGVTQAQLDYLIVDAVRRGQTTEQVANASITGRLGDYGVRSPFAANGVGVNIGVEYRKEELTLNPDATFRAGDLAGIGGATLPISGSFDVKEAFAETRIPLIEDRPFFRSLGVELGYRRSEYSVQANDFGTDTYKFAADWVPVEGLRLRGGYNRAVRAPNIVELYAQQRTGLGGTTDPCAGPVVNGRVNGNTFEQCARTGVTAAQFGSIQPNTANQYLALLGGNPDLRPEQANTYTAGLVLTPAFLHGFSLTVDWFDIALNNQIDTLGADNIVLQCLTVSQYCANIRRDQFGSLFRTQDGYVINTNLNAGGLTTRGIDVSAAWTRRFGWGSIDANLAGTWLSDFRLNRIGLPEYDCAGAYGTVCGIPRPDWRHKARVGYTSPTGIGVSAQWRYFSSVDLDRSRDAVPGTLLPNDRLDSRSYFDLTATARINDRFDLRAGVNNLLDRDPPIVNNANLPGIFGNGNTFPQIYDYAGRYMFVGASVRL